MKTLFDKMEHVVQLVLAAISGGVVAAVLNYFTNARTAKKSEFDIVVATWQHDNDRLRNENAVLHTELQSLRLELADLRSKVILMESAHSDAPLPMWLKDINGRMLSVNKAYEESVLIPMGKTATDYIGKTDFDIWPKEIAAVFKKNDIEAIETGRAVWAIEEGNGQKYQVIKYIRYAGNIKLGIAGIAIPMPE